MSVEQPFQIRDLVRRRTGRSDTVGYVGGVVFADPVQILVRWDKGASTFERADTLIAARDVVP